MKDYIVVKEWETKVGLKAVVIKIDREYMKHYCGYVGVERGHPLFGKGYQTNLKCLNPLVKAVEKGTIGKRGVFTLLTASFNGKISPTINEIFDVHGSITFADTSKDYPIETKTQTHWLGFDCAHAGDNIAIQNLEYCVKECESLAKQMREVEACKN